MGRSRSARNGNERRKLTARLRALGMPCAICGEAIDYSLPPGDDWAFECDEVVPVALGGSELEWANLQPAHRVCNRLKGARVGFRLPCKPPRGATWRWVRERVAMLRGGGAAPRREEQPTSQGWL